MSARSPRPVLGLICCTRSVEGEPGQAVMNRYVCAAARHSEASVLLVPSLAGAADPKDVATRLDGLLLTGSPSNVEPKLYGEDGGRGPFDPDRDDMALRLARTFHAAGKPVFGVCRGLQELNVAFGGTLRRDTAENPGLLSHHAARGASLDEMFAHTHAVSLTPGGILARGLGVTRLQVNSVHFQGVGELGVGLTLEALAPDGLVEAFSGPAAGAPLLAVQWHPEWDPDGDRYAAGFFHILGRALRGQALA